MQCVFRPKEKLNWVLQEFSGPDARDFLHRMTTVNVHRLAPGDGVSGFFLSSNGRIRAQFFLGCIADDRFVFEYDAGKDQKWTSALVETIEQFTFAERQRLAPPSNLECLWIFCNAATEISSHPQLSECVVLDHGAHDFGSNWISVWGDTHQIEAWKATHA
ncbi:MAG: hypothetical protein KGQ59_11005, partial [Bdellovibrionales bacterium]|nr:hypothetical protein [Bdellovibrionales bacterium]